MLSSIKSKKKASSRKQIAIKGVRDGILELTNNHYRAVLHISSVNFELKSEAEQDALIDTYQSFLNSLNTDLQIIVRVREMDIDKYLESFKDQLELEKKKIYREQIKNYTTFVKSLITANKILTRKFYIVIPHDSQEKDFSVIREQLNLTVDIVSKGLARLGMHSRQLDSLEVLDLFYNLYNPSQAKYQPLSTQTLKLLSESYL